MSYLSGFLKKWSVCLYTLPYMDAGLSTNTNANLIARDWEWIGENSFHPKCLDLISET